MKEKLEKLLTSEDIEVKSGESKILSSTFDKNFVSWKLDKDIAISIFSEELKKIALCRNVNSEEFIECVNNMIGDFKETNPDTELHFNMQLFGGQTQEAASEYVNNILEKLLSTELGASFVISPLPEIGDIVHSNDIKINCLIGESL